MRIQVLPDFVEAIALELHRRLMVGGNFCFPTGRTMDPVYARLVELNQQTPVDPSRINAFMVDEYEGLPATDPRCYNAYLRERVLGPLGLVERFYPMNEATYEALIQEKGGIDLQLLGLGLNGHIGFNEPGSSFASRTRRVAIAEATRVSNAPLFASLAEVPTHAVSIGIATIMDAKEVWVLASGASKAAIVAKLRETAVTEELPASVLKRHPKAMLYMDRAASLN